MSFPLHIFKKYDIRGLVQTEITTDLAREIGRAFGTLIQRELAGKPPTIVVGMDMRETSPQYAEALISGLMSVGVHVVEIGLVSTPAFYFSVGHLEADGGVMVSASHNPAAYNGFKMTRRNAIPVSGDSGILDLARMIEEKDYVVEAAGSREVFEGIPALAAKAEFMFAGDRPIRKMNIVVDSANGMGAQYMDELLKMIDADVERMYWEFDGSFPNHEADPMKEENMVALQQRVKETGADLGIALDGDGDRIFFVDDQGARVEPSVIRGVIAEIMLRSHPGATICYDVRPGKITRDLIVEHGGVPSLTRVGHSLIKEQMRLEHSPFGGESSGHFFFAFPVGTFEGPVTVTTMILQELTARGQTASDYFGPLGSRYVHSGEINYEVQDKDAVIARIKSVFADGELSELDGISITYPTFWFNVRGSNTEPKLRLNLEAVDRATMEQKRDEVIQLITE